MKSTHIIEALGLLYDTKRPAFIWGAPGIGKSDTIRSFVQSRGVAYIDFRAIYREPVDMRGIPSVLDGHTVYNPPAELPQSGEGVLCLEELNSAPPATQAACYQLVLDRCIGDYRLPDGWRIFAAGNRESDRGVTFKMPTPLANRFVHLDYEVDLADWSTWAVTHGIRAEVIAFLRFRQELLHNFDPQSASKAFPTPRSWQFVSEILAAGPSPEIEHEIYKGTVGEGAAAEFVGFLRVFRTLPSPDAILMNPAMAEVPTAPATLFALCTALARRATDANFDRIVTYANRMASEFSTCLISDAVRRTPALQSTGAFTTWAATHGTLI